MLGLPRRHSHPARANDVAATGGGKEVFNDEKVVLVMVGLPARCVSCASCVELMCTVLLLHSSLCLPLLLRVCVCMWRCARSGKSFISHKITNFLSWCVCACPQGRNSCNSNRLTVSTRT